VIAGFGTASGMRVAHNLILLCQWHHTAVHEGGMTIRKTEDGASWQFVMPDGSPHMPWYTGDTLPNLLRFQLGKQRASIAKITSMQDPAATTILPRWSGEPFHLHECVQALSASNFQIKINKQHSPG
jgi:hypothetical protein